MAARPFKNRKISVDVIADYYKPRGVPLCDLETVILELDEFEAVKLADWAEMYQAEAAEEMNVSRQTFGNIIKSAHKKIADALVNGKAIQIQSDGVAFPDVYRCLKCGEKWEDKRNIDNCPECDSDEIEALKGKMRSYIPENGCKKRHRGGRR